MFVRLVFFPPLIYIRLLKCPVSGDAPNKISLIICITIVPQKPEVKSAAFCTRHYMNSPCLKELTKLKKKILKTGERKY